MRIVHVLQGLGIGWQECLVASLSPVLVVRNDDPAVLMTDAGKAVRRGD